MIPKSRPAIFFFKIPGSLKISGMDRQMVKSYSWNGMAKGVMQEGPLNLIDGTGVRLPPGVEPQVVSWDLGSTAYINGDI